MHKTSISYHREYMINMHKKTFYMSLANKDSNIHELVLPFLRMVEIQDFENIKCL